MRFDAEAIEDFSIVLDGNKPCQDALLSSDENKF